MQKYDVAVIGGGAAGLACAVELKKRNKNITVSLVEAGERVGRKLAATGNGQGNVCNVDMSSSHFHGSGAFLAGKLCCNGLYDVLSLFDCLFVSDKLGRIYPAGKQASALTDCLLRKAEAYGVKVLTATKVTDIHKGYKLILSNGEDIAADYVVLAAGGKAQKQFGTDGNAYALVQSLGHTLTALYSSLVQLKCNTRFIKTLKGIRTECRVSAFNKNGKLIASTVGDVIFTDYGVSGNAIFYISAYCAGDGSTSLSLEFLPEISREDIELDVQRKIEAGYVQTELLSGTLHNQLGRAVIRRCQIEGRSVTAGMVADTVKNFTLEIEGTLGFDYAQVTKGGVPAGEVDENLQSKLVKNLYLAGEIFDVDGDCGGYNLTWAFASGMHVAKCVAENFYDND